MTVAAAPRPARWWLSVLLLAGAALFTVGVVRERSGGDRHVEAAAPASSGPVAETGDEAAEATARTAAAAPAAEPGTEASEASEGTVLGVNPESSVLVVVAVAASLALAAALLGWRARRVVFATIAFAALFTVFDVAEAFHQSAGSHTGLLVVALAVALTHIAAILLAFSLLPVPVTDPATAPAVPVR